MDKIKYKIQRASLELGQKGDSIPEIWNLYLPVLEP